MARTYTVKIRPISPVVFAVPGIRQVHNGDSLKFHNMTKGPIEVRMAARGVLTGLTNKTTKKILPGEFSPPFKVVGGLGTHEYSVHYEYEEKKYGKTKTRTGFAIGASSPKVVVIPP